MFTFQCVAMNYMYKILLNRFFYSSYIFDKICADQNANFPICYENNLFYTKLLKFSLWTPKHLCSAMQIPNGWGNI